MIILFKSPKHGILLSNQKNYQYMDNLGKSQRHDVEGKMHMVHVCNYVTKVAYVMIPFTWQSQKDTALWLPEVRVGAGVPIKGSMREFFGEKVLFCILLW